MKESLFIKQNKEKWIDLEKRLDSGERDPDKLSDLFIQVSDDLSYARTFYPNRSVRLYLNNLTQKVYSNIYKNRRSSWADIVFFLERRITKNCMGFKKRTYHQYVCIHFICDYRCIFCYSGFGFCTYDYK